MIRAARGFGKPETATQKKSTNDVNDEKENLKLKDQIEEQEEEEKEGNERKFTFLKRKSRNPGFQKVRKHALLQ